MHKEGFASLLVSYAYVRVLSHQSPPQQHACLGGACMTCAKFFYSMVFTTPRKTLMFADWSEAFERAHRLGLHERCSDVRDQCGPIH